MSTDHSHPKSEISWKTKPELHLSGARNSMTWSYRDDDGALVPLDAATHTLIVDYGESQPNASIELHIYNDTDADIDLKLSAYSSAFVTPKGLQRVKVGGCVAWACNHAGGDDCPCGLQEGTCRCGRWDITGTLRGRPIPDPTFKVRWQAHGEPPSAP